MADSKLTTLTEDTSPSSDDNIYLVNDPGGTPTSKRVALSNLLKFVHGLTENTTPATTDELALIDDPSSSPAAQRISLINMLKVINGLTQDSTPDTAADFLLSYDVSASTVKKVLIEDVVPPSTGYDYLSTLVNTEVSITGATTANWGKQHVVTGSTNYTITLQACSGNTGKFMSFRILNTGITTLDGNSSETIDGVTTMACYQGQNITLYCDGTNVHVINLKAGNMQQWFSPLQFASNFTKKYTVRTSQPYNFAMEQNSGAADGDWISVMFFANKGTYTVSILGFTAGSCAKQDWSLNGVNQTTGQDWYSSSTVYNVVKTFTMTVPYTGVHTLKSTINGRNASASGWDFQITAIAF